MATSSHRVSLEPLAENEIQEIAYDGTEKTVMCENIHIIINILNIINAHSSFFNLLLLNMFYCVQF